MFRKSLVAVVATFLALALLPPTASADETVEDTTVTSLAEDGISIAITVFQPDAASPENPVPVILDSHGWGGSRRTAAVNGNDTTVRDLLDAGFGVVSIDQRGHGDSGGLRNVQDPDLEGQDIKAVIDYVAALDWVAHNTTIDPETGETIEIPTDPILGAIGGSYGGGYQTITALTEIRETGSTRFDALAPEITWYDLPTSLAPQGVPRTAWTTLLYAVSKAPENKIAEYIDTAFAYGAASGHFPGSEPELEDAETEADIPDLTEIFRSHSPRGFVRDGFRLDVPSLFRQGITDNLFNLNEGIHNFQNTLTDSARSRSLFVGYNGGHVLPGVGSTFPLGTAPGSSLAGGEDGDPCSGGENGWRALRIEFFKTVFAGGDPSGLLPARYNLATNDGECLSVDSLGTLQDADVDPADLGGWGTPVGVFAPHHYELIEGPVTVAGIPRMTGEILNAGVDTRAFFALSVGASPTALGPTGESAPAPAPTVIQNNMTALRKLLPHAAPSTEGQPFDIELPGVAIEIGEGQSLYLTISPISDASFGHGSKTPGLMVITGMTVQVPVVPNAQ